MSTTTASFTDLDHAAATEKAPRKGFFQRLIEARQRQGAAHVRAAFERMSDRNLADIGFSTDQIRHIRAKGSVPVEFWG